VRGPLDISRAEVELGYHPMYDLQRGMANLAEWEMAHREEYMRWPKNDLWLV
jgi:nucleoside-diphosphate-sugar epimerase